MGARLLICAGESSGDQLAAELLTELRERQPQVSAVGLGGPALRAAGMDVVVPAEELAVVGLAEVVGKLPVFFRTLTRIRRILVAGDIDLVMLVDFPDFNLRVASIARGLGIRRAIVAPYAGVFSAFGFACADIERYWIRGFARPWEGSALDELNTLFGELAAEAAASSRDWGQAESQIEFARYADLRYRQQASELSIPLPAGQLDGSDLASARDAFHAEHEKTFGHAFPGSPLEVASVRLASRIPLARPTLSDATASETDQQPATGGRRKAYFGDEAGFVETGVVAEAELDDTPRNGPLLIDRYDTTFVVPPGCQIRAAAGGSLVIDIG